jgi:cytochrome d ubiquinol oxidase subunit II
VVELWFALVSFTLIMFAVLDGWNFGVGVVHMIVGKTDAERRHVIDALGPNWSWHEVWLIAAGGTFLLAFPIVMATSFSGFYLALWMLLWSFVLRGMSIEVGGHLDDRLWRRAWDFTFTASSTLLAFLFGTAFGNVIRGVPLDASRTFSMWLFTDFTARGEVGILDWYTLSVAVFTTFLLAAHGASYLAIAAAGTVHERSVLLARRLWVAVLALFPVVTVETRVVRPELFHLLVRRPIAWLTVVVLIAGAWAVWSGLRGGRERRAFIGSCAILVGLLAGAAASVFPVMLHSTIAPEYSLTAYNGSSPGPGLAIALLWWPLAAILAIGYFAIVSRNLARTRIG